MQVCRMRNTPVIIFVNKLDREGKNAFFRTPETALETKLKIHVQPLSWPISMGTSFEGILQLL